MTPFIEHAGNDKTRQMDNRLVLVRSWGQQTGTELAMIMTGYRAGSVFWTWTTEAVSCDKIAQQVHTHAHPRGSARRAYDIDTEPMAVSVSTS